MLIFDAHCDTLTKAYEEKDYSLCRNGGHWDSTRAGEIGDYIGTFAAFIEDGEKSPFQTGLAKLRAIRQEPTISVVQNSEEAERALSEGKVAAFLSVENGLILEGDSANLERLQKEGIRFFGLTWNGANELSDGAMVKNPSGLTAFGREMVKRLQEKNIFVDVSHLAEPGFWEVMRLASRPVVATHSNAYAVCPHPRNLKDDQFRAICETGGVVGINFYSLFLRESGRASIRDIVRHIDHFLSLGGEDHIGLGGDFDGMDSPAKGIGGVEDVLKISEALRDAGYDEALIQKLMGGNFLNLVKKLN